LLLRTHRPDDAHEPPAARINLLHDNPEAHPSASGFFKFDHIFALFAGYPADREGLLPTPHQPHVDRRG
jgi:hypothetical protein